MLSGDDISCSSVNTMELQSVGDKKKEFQEIASLHEKEDSSGSDSKNSITMFIRRTSSEDSSLTDNNLFKITIVNAQEVKLESKENSPIRPTRNALAVFLFEDLLSFYPDGLPASLQTTCKSFLARVLHTLLSLYSTYPTYKFSKSELDDLSSLDELDSLKITLCVICTIITFISLQKGIGKGMQHYALFAQKIVNVTQEVTRLGHNFLSLTKALDDKEMPGTTREKVHLLRLDMEEGRSPLNEMEERSPSCWDRCWRRLGY